MDNFNPISIWEDRYFDIHKKAYDIAFEKMMPVDWVEANISLPDGVSRYTGPFKYDLSPYVKEIVNHLWPGSSMRVCAIMKCAQNGLTQGLIIPGMMYIIAEDPHNMMFMAGDKELAKKSIRERFDPIMVSSSLSHLIRSNVMRAKNQKTGDTDFSKEYAGGNLTIEGTNNVKKMRQISVKTVFADDWDAAPKSNDTEGSLRKLIDGRQTSFGNLAKTFYVSTPTEEQLSNILAVFLLGDQRHWFWTCPCCNKKITPTWELIIGEEKYGLIYSLNEKKQVIPESVYYRCQECGGKILETSKYDLNLGGEWIPTAEPVEENYVSYQLNALFMPPGFISWVDLAKEYNLACPVGEPVDQEALKTFKNIRLGLTWKQTGVAPRVLGLTKNTRTYLPGTVPDVLCDEDQNGRIIMLTLACDLNGIMKDDIKDVRLDWEVVAWSSTGATYSVDHGSIGTFKRSKHKSQQEKDRDFERERWTYDHGVKNSVWPHFEELIQKEWSTQSGQGAMKVSITVVDTGFFTKFARQFIEKINYTLVLGVKGRTEADYRKITKDTPAITKSRENRTLYIAEVNQLKDELAQLMELRSHQDGSQPEGFMNFPQPNTGKYTMDSYFQHYSGEHRIEEIKNGSVVGFKWEKKHNDVLNHFWDVRIYNMAAREIYLQLVAEQAKLRGLTWADLVAMLDG